MNVTTHFFKKLTYRLSFLSVYIYKNDFNCQKLLKKKKKHLVYPIRVPSRMVQARLDPDWKQKSLPTPV